MIERDAAAQLKAMQGKFPVLVLTGPRQSGKTTLCKQVFSEYRYVSLENPDNLFFAQSDPKGFLQLYDKFVILDEVQNAPELFSYMQQIVDDSGIDAQFILSGSQNFLLLERITQSLAGRVFMMELLPFSQKENSAIFNQNLEESIIKGAYPRIYHKQISPNNFYPNYLQTYIERDVRSIINLHDLSLFQNFIKLLAHHAGQLLNMNNISKQLGIDSKTVGRWLSIMESSYVVFRLPPWHKNFSKRLVKSSKLYFYDVGLLCNLLGIEDAESLLYSKYRGALFENFGILEILKNYRNQGLKTPFYFWRDSNGNEIDLIIEKGNKVKCIEFKYSETVKAEYIKALHYLDNLNDDLQLSHYLFNKVTASEIRSKERIISWKDGHLLL